MMHLVIDSQLPELHRAADLVDRFTALHRLGDEDSNAIHIVVDEVLSNCIRHGLGKAKSHAIAVTLELSGREIVIGVEDDGVAFDPTQVAAPELAGTLDERSEGGMGVAFVRALTDAIEYQRIAGRNRLTLRRRLRTTS